MHRETHSIVSKGFGDWLLRRFYEDYGKPPGAQAMQEAKGVLAAKARFEGDERQVHVRVAEHYGAIYVDLANDLWEAAEITSHGWRIVSDPPVRFRRPKGMRSLPRPVSGGRVDDLRTFVNVGSEEDWRLLAGWLVQSFSPTGPYPVLVLQGEQGSAKTTAARILRTVVDPSILAVRTIPRGEQDLALAANNSWLLAFDNLSGLAPWLSDAICRLATGGGFGTRTLYENDEETLFDATRPVILNGITDVAGRADLLDRALVLTLPRIPEEKRRPEAELWSGFERAIPGILGGFFDAVSVALRERPNIRLDSLPRMADFAMWATAAEGGLGMEPGHFMEAYSGRRKESNRLALEADPVALSIVKLMEGRDEWVGTASGLLLELNEHVDEGIRRYKTWPRQPQYLSRHLTRLAPVLRSEGIEIQDLRRTGSERKKRISKIDPENDRHGRHGRHECPKARADAGNEGDAGYRYMTAMADDGRSDRHRSAPARMPGSVDCDDDDAHDGRAQPYAGVSPITSEEGLRVLVPKILGAGRVAIDVETTGLDPRKDRIRLISLATDHGIWIIDCFRVDPEPVFPALSDKTLVVHNALFDLVFMRRLGYGHQGRVSDTMILSRMVNAGERGNSGKRLEHTLEVCCERELGLKLDKIHQKSDWSGKVSEEMLDYAVEDARVLLPLRDALYEKLSETGQERAIEIEERVLLAGIEMAHNGVSVDKERWIAIVEEAGAGLDELRARLDDLAGDLPESTRKRNAKNRNVPAGRKDKWNWDSSDQIKTAAKTAGLTLQKIGIDHLKLLDHEFAKALLAYRQVRSGLPTFGRSFFQPTEDGREVYLDGRLYPSWGMCAADTGRMSCSGEEKGTGQRDGDGLPQEEQRRQGDRVSRIVLRPRRQTPLRLREEQG